jgi:hypothetical protein
MNRSTRHKSWADVAVFEDVNAGKTVETFLEGKKIQARTYDDKLFRALLFLRPPRATFRVQVRQDNLKTADYLLTTGAPDALQQAIHCPSCGSLHVSYPQMTRKFVVPTILLHLGIIFRVLAHHCYCDTCHFIWNLPEKHVYPAPQAAKPAHP